MTLHWPPTPEGEAQFLQTTLELQGLEWGEERSTIHQLEVTLALV